MYQFNCYNSIYIWLPNTISSGSKIYPRCLAMEQRALRNTELYGTDTTMEHSSN